jgi:hypothetical protein
MTTAQTVMQGAEVRTSDGEPLGKVVEVRGGAFRVDVSMMPDYWLPANCVASADAQIVRLECSKDDVGKHKIEAPAGS